MKETGIYAAIFAAAGGVALAMAASVSIAGAWSYDQRSDQMGRGTIKTARVQSTNQITFGSPYGGPQRAQLELRSHPQYGRDVIISFSRAQFLCRMDGCSVLVRFDDRKPERYSASEPSDHSTEYLFIRGFDRLLHQIRAAKMMRVEAQFFHEGNRVLEFDVVGLKWEVTPAAKGGAAGKSGTSPPQAQNPGSVLAQSKQCVICHDRVSKLVGPAFRDIAERYGSAPDTAATLARSIRVGGAGKWGQIPMPPNPAVSEAEALTLATWILTLK